LCLFTTVAQARAAVPGRSRLKIRLVPIGTNGPEHECALTDDQVQRDRDGEADGHCDGHDPAASKAVQISAGPDVLAAHDQQTDQGEHAVLDGLSSCIGAEAQNVHLTSAQHPGREWRDHDEQQPENVQLDDRRAGFAHVSEDPVMDAPV